MPHSMIGTQLGPYDILALVGSGGMGDVYRARDRTLGRDVALKLLPPGVAGDPDREARFGREARLLAALNHPHIATIHGIEETPGTRALVMELVEGPTLAERLAADAWRRTSADAVIADTLRIARQIAEALEAAHARGVIHRDVKPANIKFTLDGSVKVLDFGLATAFSRDGADHDLSHLPTMTAADLRSGGIVGTPAYMSPEQARGEAIDKRTDIWAFGCVLFEMLSGRCAFPGRTISDTIAAILEREPAWDALPSQTPPGIHRLLRRCLQKDADRRLHDIADARIEIDDAASGAPEAQAARAPRPAAPLLWTGLGALLATTIAIGVWNMRPAPALPESRLEIVTPPSRDAALAVSPDGLKVVFAAAANGPSQLWLRALDSPAARPLPGTDHGTTPFWSPDSRSIAFFADARLKRVDIDGGSVRTLTASAAVPLGGSWNRDGTIIFADSPGGPISRISETGGERSAVTRVDAPRQRGHFFPRFLPDGRHFLFFVSGTSEVRGVYLGDLDGPGTTRLLESDSPAEYASSGHLLFMRGTRLMAQRFNLRELAGEAWSIDDHLSRDTALSASASGPIVYRGAPADDGERQLVWVDRTGRELDKVRYADTAALGPSLSHDGRHIAAYRFEQGNMDIWTYEMRRRAWDRLTFDQGDDIYPLWSHDDRSIVFAGVRKGGPLSLYRKIVGSGQDEEELLLQTASGGFPMDWSGDGRFVLYQDFNPRFGLDIWALPLEGERKPFEVVRTDFNETMPQFSPDGRWIAYQSDKTGRVEIYLRPFPGAGPDTRASTEGGGQVRWNPDGRELFYVGADDRLMSVALTFTDAKTVEPANPVALFATKIGSTATLVYRQQYLVGRDGQSFILNSVVSEASSSPITVILNWKPRR